MGAVCISIVAATAAEFISLARDAFRSAEAVELRFDSLPPEELPGAVRELRRLKKDYDGTVVGTLRSSRLGQGGHRDLTEDDIGQFWNDPSLEGLVDWIDIGTDDGIALPKNVRTIIRSLHSFKGIPDKSEVRELLTIPDEWPTAERRVIYKLAALPSDITDILPLWNDPAIPRDSILIGMGEFGIWTRVLGLSRGAELTFASAGEGSEAAPGQVPFNDLVDVYKTDTITPATAVYGILGRPVGHSLSPFIHNAAFAARSLDAVYLPLAAGNARRFWKEMADPVTRALKWDLRGLSVTHPHKTVLASLVDELHPAAKAIGAVNTVKIENGVSKGYNTDAAGFLASLGSAVEGLQGSRAGIIGSGGAARAAAFALRDAGATVTLFSRDPAKVVGSLEGIDAAVKALRQDEDVFVDIDILINASPVGSAGALEGRSPVAAESLKNVRLVYDMVYNPGMTRLLKDASELGIPTIGGLEMLIQQAALQFEIWTSQSAPTDVMRSAAESRLSRRPLT